MAEERTLLQERERAEDVKRKSGRFRENDSREERERGKKWRMKSENEKEKERK